MMQARFISAMVNPFEAAQKDMVFSAAHGLLPVRMDMTGMAW
jgi:hypothetical protein